MKPYADPYVAGVALGLVLLAAFVFAGRGLGASGAFTRVADAVVSPASRQPPTDNWLLYELGGVIVGGFASALLAGRVRFETERGPRISRNGRIAFAFGGGAAMGVGAVLARGCTSGLALTGGALLSVGSWIFMLAAFASAYALAPLLRRAWR
ncbi:MAG TPA: YeeE/YedE thiosulfate transporter family protein [Thermoanaerobaculia bacterium]|nr:YeeE/YedE thiosulfate transporter family protein [Thermoanaerobaculia bacterium]